MSLHFLQTFEKAKRQFKKTKKIISRLEIEPGVQRPQVQRLTTWASTDLPKQSVEMFEFLEYINVKNNPLYDITRMHKKNEIKGF